MPAATGARRGVRPGDADHGTRIAAAVQPSDCGSGALAGTRPATWWPLPCTRSGAAPGRTARNPEAGAGRRKGRRSPGREPRRGHRGEGTGEGNAVGLTLERTAE